MIKKLHDFEKINSAKYEELKNLDYDLNDSDIEDYFTENERREGISFSEMPDTNAIKDDDILTRLTLEGFLKKLELMVVNTPCFTKGQVVEFGLSQGLIDGQVRTPLECAKILKKNTSDVEKDLVSFYSKLRTILTRKRSNYATNEEDAVDNVTTILQQKDYLPGYRENNGYNDFLAKYIPTVKNDEVKNNLTKIYNNCVAEKI